MLIVTRKAVVFDAYTHLIIKEEQFKYFIKQPEQLDKEKALFKKEEHLFEIDSIYKIKDNSFFLLSKENEAFFLNLPRINEIRPITIDYSMTRIRIVKQSFQLRNWFNRNSSLSLYSNEEFLLYHINNNKIIISFLDSVEELTQLASYTSKEKHPIIFLNSLIIGRREHFIAIYRDLRCELFSYVKSIREIRLEHLFKLIYDEEIKETQFITDDNILIAYTEQRIALFNLKLNSKEISASQTIDLANIFDAKTDQSLSFTNYFRANFSNYLTEVERQLEPQYAKEKNDISVTASVLFAYSENKSIYYIIGTNSGKIALFDIFFTETFLLTPLIMIDYHKSSIISLTVFDNRILISASSDGMITFTDICSQKIEAAINKNESRNEDDKIDINTNNDNGNQTGNKFNNDFQPKMYFGKKRSDSVELFTKQFNYSFVRKLSLHNKKGRQGNMNSESELQTIQLVPFKKIKNYSKLTRICKVIQLDTDPNDSFQSKPYLGFEIEDRSMLIMKMDSYEIIYRYYNSDTLGAVKGVYHRQSKHALIFYLGHHVIKVASYLTRTYDRYISDPETMYDLLNTEETLSNLFSNKNDISAYVSNISMSSLKYQEPDPETNKQLRTSSIIGSQSSPKKIKVTLESIEGYVTNESLKELFITKYYQDLSLSKQSLNTSINNQDSHSDLIDSIIQIITDTKEIHTNSAYQDERIKKIEIMNLVYNPQYFINLQRVDNSVCMKSKSCTGVLSNLIYIGNQYAQFVSFDYETYFAYLENVIQTQENIDNSIFRTNYFNWISLFHIWNFSIDLDTFLYQKYKLVQPIFNFCPILLGENDACSFLLANCLDIDHTLGQPNNKFSHHFDYFLNFVNVAFLEQKKGESNSVLKKSITSLNGDHSKRDLFLNKSALLEQYQGFLVNFMNYKLSTTTSHHLHILLFSSLIALLGYKLNTELCEFIDSEKKIMKILSSKNLIDYCNLEMFHQLMYTDLEDMSLANNGLILIDYLTLENNQISNSGSSNRSKPFLLSLQSLMSYLSKVYMFIFDLPSEDMLYPTFSQLNRNLNLDACGKLEFLSEFELSIVSYILNYGVIAQENKLPHLITVKAFELLILFAFKIINSEDKASIKMSYAKIVIELLEKSNELVDEIYKDNMTVYSKILIDFYTFSLSPINLEALFKPFAIGTIKMIKSKLNHNFLKIILAKLIKLFSRTKLNYLLKLIVEEFKRKHNTISNNDYYTYLIELLWLLMKDRHSKIPQYLPTVANLIMITLSPLNKDFKNQCIDYSKKVLSALMANYPMISFHSLTQKLVVGATDGKIYIYDIVTGNLWKNWVAHDSEVTAVVLDSKGAMLLSYSSTDCFVKYWTIGLTNFFRNFFSMKDGYYKQKKLPQILMQISPEEKLSTVKFQAIPKKDNEIVLIRENKTVEIFKI